MSTKGPVVSLPEFMDFGHFLGYYFSVTLLDFGHFGHFVVTSISVTLVGKSTEEVGSYCWN